MKMLDQSNLYCFKSFWFMIDKNDFLGDFYHIFLI